MRYRLGATFTLVMVMIVATVGLVAKGPVAVEAGLVEYNAVNLGKQADPIVPAPQGVDAPDAENVQFVSSLGGNSFAVAVQSNFAYLGEGRRLTILNVSNPASPVVVGKTPRLPSRVDDIAVAGSYAYVVDGDGWLRIIDVTNAGAPAEAGSYATPKPATSVEVVGSTAYVTDGGGGLWIIDVTNPAAPVATGFYDTAGFAADVAVAGSFAYIAAGEQGLRIINVANPAAPDEIGFFTTTTPASDVAVESDHVYITTSYGFNIPYGVWVIDVSDASYPAEAGFYDMSGAGVIGNLVVSENYLYVLSDGDVDIVDVADPANPIQVGAFAHSSSAITLANNIIYSAELTGGLTMIAVGDPLNPAPIGYYDIPGAGFCVVTTGNHVYLADWQTLNVIDVSNPSVPIQAGRLKGLGCEDMVLVGRYLYVVASGFHVIDMAQPTAPREVGFLELIGSEKIDVSNNYAYVTKFDGGLYIVDVSDPTNPTEAGFFNTTGEPYDIAAFGTYAYLAVWQEGLRIIDVANPTSPVEVGVFDPAGGVARVVLAGHYAYVSQCYLGVSILDLTDPATPIQVGWISTPGYCYPRIAVVGSYAYVLADDVLHVVDITDPAQPTEAGSHEVPGTDSVAVFLNHIYLADSYDGLVVLRFDDISVENSFLALIAAER